MSDSVPPALVDRVASTFTRSDGDIRECLRTIFTSPEFFSRAAYKAKVKSPFELVVSAMRVVGAQPDSTPRTAQLIAKLGEPLYGHLAPNGYPERGDAWINTGAILARINFGLIVASGRVPGASLAEWTDGQSLAALPHDAAGGRRHPRDPRRRSLAGYAQGARERREPDGERQHGKRDSNLAGSR